MLVRTSRVFAETVTYIYIYILYSYTVQSYPMYAPKYKPFKISMRLIVNDIATTAVTSSIVYSFTFTAAI